MDTRNAHHNGTRGTLAQARADLGLRGIVYGRAYVYAERCGHYHVGNVNATTRIPAHGKVRGRIPLRVAQRHARIDVRTRSVWDAIIPAPLRAAAHASRVTALARAGYGL